MSVRKRTWKSPSGEMREAWVVDYVDQHGDRHLKTFAKKRDADAHHAIVGPPSAPAPIRPTARASPSPRPPSYGWRAAMRPASSGPRSPPTGSMPTLHIVPILGALRLSHSPSRWCAASRNGSGRTGARRRWCAMPAARSAASSPTPRSAAWSARTWSSRCARTAAHGARRQRQARDRDRHPLAGRDPCHHRRSTIDDAAAGGRCCLTAIFTGLRASELRGLRWSDVDLKRGELHVRQRADRYGTIGRPKSEAGKRTVPLPPMVVTALREHRLASPTNDQDIVFPNSRGSIEHRNTIVEHGLHPAQIAAGVVDRRRRGQVQGPPRTPPFLRLVVHQSAGRRRPRTAAQGGAGAARPCLDSDDGRHLRAPVPAHRRRRRAGGSGAGVPRWGD